MASLHTYLNFNGNTEEVFNFYKSVFGGEFTTFTRFGDNPGSEGIPAEEQHLLMHVCLPIGENSMLMGSDCPSVMQPVVSGTAMSISIFADSRAQADHLFNGLAQGGKIQMPLEDMFWGDYFGMLTDKFGVQWLISYTTKN